MSVAEKKKRVLRGGEFLVKDTAAEEVFISENFSEEQMMMRESAYDFIAEAIDPQIEVIDSMQNPDLPPQLLKQCGEIGFLGMGVPEAYGGFETDFNTTLSGSEVMGGAGSFTLTIGVQTSIGIAPILFYGNEAQKAKYLPDMVTGELRSCYCLTEPDSGSDANSGKTRAVPTEDGKHYILNGQKMWITNAGFADIFIVFAKIEDDENLSAFIVEKAFGGISLGEEEKKMGIKGSSTRQVFFSEVKVPAENLLGERGQGFKIALNVLNTGRIKLAASALGVGKKALKHSAVYASERKQFGTEIANFGAIKHKLGQISAQLYALDAALYRTGSLIDRRYEEMVEGGMDPVEAKHKSVEAYAIECALLKVYGSEVQAYTVDEAVQIYGGMGFSAESPVERLYRDARISRIFEGTNEINRMLSIDMLMKKAMKGQIDLLSPAKELTKELTSLPNFDEDDSDPLASEKKVLANLRKVFFLAAGSAVQKLMNKLKDEQEILLNAADILIAIYTFESALLKTEKLLQERGQAACAHQLDMLRILAFESVMNADRAAREIIYAFADEGEINMLLMGLKRFTKLSPFNAKEARRRLADKVVENGGWKF